jgi:hypothetical protein
MRQMYLDSSIRSGRLCLSELTLILRDSISAFKAEYRPLLAIGKAGRSP